MGKILGKIVRPWWLMPEVFFVVMILVGSVALGWLAARLLIFG